MFMSNRLDQNSRGLQYLSDILAAVLDNHPNPPSKKRKTSLRLTGQADRMFLTKKTIINEVQPI
jgi:hypothetical protein